MSRRVRVSLVEAAGPGGRDAAEIDPDADEAPPASRTAIVAPLTAGRDGRSRVEVVVDGWRFELVVEDAARAEIRAIIPGRVAAVRVVAGDAVEAGRTLLIVEAMKMQNELRAPRAGTVERVAVGEGQTIENGDVLVVLR